jgi:EmrB/QacA subfamily drug resistance transporter
MHKPATNIRWTTLALILGLLMAALDSSIVSTAMPAVISQLGGMDKFVWVFSAYMIASVAAMPVFGKLSDMYGRKLLYLSCLGLFMAGSALCGAATSMTQLIVFRALQGIGGGSILPITFTIVFDMFPPEQKAKQQGIFGGVFGMSSVLGPIVGGLFTDVLNWHWIFYINLPLGVFSFILVAKYYRESARRHKQAIDWLGGLTLTGAIVGAMFALELGGKSYGWTSPTIVGLLAASVLMLIVFVRAERKAADPVIPLQLFRNRLFAVSMGITFLLAASSINQTYVPLFVQGVLGQTASSSGQIMTPMMLSVIFSSIASGAIIGKLSYRNLMLISIIVMSASAFLLGALLPESSRWTVSAFTVLGGLGLGTSLSVLTICALQSVEEEHRGTVNSLLSSFRYIGGSIGITILGGLQRHTLETQLSSGLDAKTAKQFGEHAQMLLQPEIRAKMPQSVLDTVTAALAHSISSIYFYSLIFVVGSFILVWFMGTAKYSPEKERQTWRRETTSKINKSATSEGSSS